MTNASQPPASLPPAIALPVSLPPASVPPASLPPAILPSVSHPTASLSPASLPPDTIPEIALSWLRAGRRVYLATVVETWGSAPRSPGAQMVVDGSGAMMGSVSGGCVEGAVVAEAMAGGPARLLSYGVTDDAAFAVGLACGGKVTLLLEPVGAAPTALATALLEGLVAARAALSV